MDVIDKVRPKSTRKLTGLIYPHLRNAQFTYRDTLMKKIPRTGIWLDLGCGHQVLPSWMPGSAADEQILISRSRLVVGVDGDADSLRKHRSLRAKALADIEVLPFRNDSVDLVTANMVAEHVQHPEALFKEVRRVLKRGGLFIFHTPNFHSYVALISMLMPRPIKLRLIYYLEGRPPADVFPAYYRMNTQREISRLARKHKFQIAEMMFLNSDPETGTLGPLSAIELVFLRILKHPWFEHFRSNIIAVLEKSSARGGDK